MAILTKNAASKLDYAPSTAYLAQVTKSDDPPGYLVWHGDRLMVDTEHEEWRDMIERRRDEAIRGKRRGAGIDFTRPDNKQGTRKTIESSRPKQPLKQKQSKSKKSKSKPAEKQNNNSDDQKPNEMQQYESRGIDTDTASTDDELNELVEKSRKAKILEPILKAELQQHKIEMNKLEMQKEAGSLIEYQLAEFLFLGYLEKLNLENLKLFDKLEPMIKNLCKENKPKDLIKLLKREQENILVEIKRAQKEDVKKWKEEK